MDRDHRDLCADLPADAEAFRNRSDSLGRAGVRQSSGRLPIAAGGHVGVLSQGRRAPACDVEPDLLRHDAVYADRDPMHDVHVHMARHDAVAPELPVRQLDGAEERRHTAGKSPGEDFMPITRRSIVAGAIAAPMLMRIGSASAQNWPSGIIKIVVPFPPGGTVDPIARLVQNGLQQRLGATIVIENKSGGSGSAGTASVAKSAPDGNTWLFVFDTHAVNPFLQALSFDTQKDLDPVVLIGTAPNVLATHPSRPYKSFAEVIDAAKARPDTLTYASVGSGSVGHLTMVQLSKRAGIKMVHVPYRGGGPAMNDALAGHVDFIIGSAALVMPQLR